VIAAFVPIVAPAASVSGAIPSDAGSMGTARSVSIARIVQTEASVRGNVEWNPWPGMERVNDVVEVNWMNNHQEKFVTKWKPSLTTSRAWLRSTTS